MRLAGAILLQQLGILNNLAGYFKSNLADIGGDIRLLSLSPQNCLVVHVFLCFAIYHPTLKMRWWFQLTLQNSNVTITVTIIIFTIIIITLIIIIFIIIAIIIIIIMIIIIIIMVIIIESSSWSSSSSSSLSSYPVASCDAQWRIWLPTHRFYALRTAFVWWIPIIFAEFVEDKLCACGKHIYIHIHIHFVGKLWVSPSLQIFNPETVGHLVRWTGPACTKDSVKAERPYIL